ncbi:fatty acyl-AMP ligase [Gramella jeungdoensis]|uniref:Fatty acyl-AMP ligase n=1 Tax=Gramella jeungdoensis TaxID=708091 RepID=A0ABT0Z1X7_9FLAO|nr:fatty acyl-AMP ligase [Gramella jeungdoensis]MCM8569380.1 fatty acyl-AMP ligase [Gramella jeungdoensis]
MVDLQNSLVDILSWRANHQPHKLAYRFQLDGENDELSITYKELDLKARSIGSTLQNYTKKFDRVILLLPCGLEFIAAFLGCLYARVIAIPLPPPHPARVKKTLAATLRIIKDANPSVALLDSSLLKSINSQTDIKSQLSKLTLIPIDQENMMENPERWVKPGAIPEEIAFLQYTSGSTLSPRGVMISHGNLLSNLYHIEKSFEQNSRSRTVIWLPPYHDMGLIGGILQPLFTGNIVTLMPHLMFLQRPIRWLKAISRFRATTSGGPNFAYELCLRKIRPDQLEGLDLSSWDVAFNGAEPINLETLERFSEYFAPCGFRPEAFLTCYGLAEATLMVSGVSKAKIPEFKRLNKRELANHRAINSSSPENSLPVVSCGQVSELSTLMIVNPESLMPCAANEIGEVWISGPNVASGYWNRPLDTVSTFQAQLRSENNATFLRTGDLGFIDEGELFITGRLKNMVIIDGKNYYPHDIERTVEKSHQDIQTGGCAVFSFEKSGNEVLVVLVEIRRNSDLNKTELLKDIRKAISEEYELPVFDIKLTVTGSIPRTTSGKIMHFLCKEKYLQGTLNENAVI